MSSPTTSGWGEVTLLDVDLDEGDLSGRACVRCPSSLAVDLRGRALTLSRNANQVLQLRVVGSPEPVGNLFDLDDDEVSERVLYGQDPHPQHYFGDDPNEVCSLVRAEQGVFVFRATSSQRLFERALQTVGCLRLKRTDLAVFEASIALVHPGDLDRLVISPRPRSQWPKP